MALATAIAVGIGAWAEPTVTDITAKQRYPWNGLVDISCKVSGIEADAGGYEFVVVAVNKETGREYTVSDYSVKHGGEDVSGMNIYEDGTYNLLWNVREDMGQVVFERMTVRITLEAVAEEEVVEDENLDARQKVQLWADGPYWADRNIGASKPWKYGLYFWWGDTKGHRPSGTTFGFSSTSPYPPTYGRTDDMLQSEGWVVSKNGTYVLAPAHDAAHVKWGGSWRMPTYEEIYDLCYTYCDWTWTTRNGVHGYIVRGRGSYASNSIFLPAAGAGYGTAFYNAGIEGGYCSSVPHSGIYSWAIGFRSNGRGLVGNNYRNLMISVRPVQGFSN